MSRKKNPARLWLFLLSFALLLTALAAVDGTKIVKETPTGLERDHVAELAENWRAVSLLAASGFFLYLGIRPLREKMPGIQ
jgi:hypothetical protein